VTLGQREQIYNLELVLNSAFVMIVFLKKS